MRTCLVALLVGLVCSAVTPEPGYADAPPGTQPASPSFQGTWQTTFGEMTLKQVGGKVTGTYGSGGLTGEIVGTVEERKLNFTYKEPDATGEGSFELSGDGSAFAGRWRVAGQQAWSPWNGKRTDAPPDPADTFAGVWNTSFGAMRLFQEDRKVHGVYAFAGQSTLTGQIDDKGVLQFTYDQPDGETGKGSFTLSAAADSFTGTWTGDKKDASVGGAWTGKRVTPRPGIVWLVILEAPWERQLRDPEFSYGHMLRTYFARVPKVQVRHRAISDEADVRRWCQELPYFAEPVVLYFSSHGTKEGLLLGDKTIGADVLLDCVRNVPSLKLLHFGSCLVCSGDIPGKLHKGLGKAGSFPISGFVHPADWAGSALVDFAYLELIFSHGLPPARAADQVRKMMTFASDKPTPGTAIAPTGLVVIEPPSSR